MSEDYNRLYYHATSTGSRRALLLLEGKSLLVSGKGHLKDDGDERYVLKSEDVRAWDEGFIRLSPSGRLPVLDVKRSEEGSGVVCGRSAVSEYIVEKYYGDELWGGLGLGVRGRVRTFVDYMDEAFEEEVILPFLQERLGMGWDTDKGREINVERLRVVRKNLERHLGYFEYILCRHRNVAGERRTLADVAFCASLTLLDHLGEVSWGRYEFLSHWYRVQKSFCKVLLGEYIPGIHPPDHYNRLL